METRGSPPDGRGRHQWILGAVLIALVVAVAVWIVVFLLQDEATTPATGVSIGEISDNPSLFLGETVTVRGDVTRLVGGSAFLVGEAGNELLVVGAQLPEAVSEGDSVQVRGRVRSVAVPELEEELAVDFEDDLLTPFAGKPAIAATSVRRTGGG